MTNCTEPNRAACPRLCSDYCNAIEEAEACRSAPACSPSSDTPETDTAEFEVIDDYECGIYVVSSCHARMLELERDEWRNKYIQQNKDLGCELLDPNGTIWDHAKTLQRERDELKSLLTKKQGAVTISRNGYVQELERERDEAREQLTIKCEQLEQQRNALCSFINREMGMSANDSRISELKRLLENAPVLARKPAPSDSDS